MSPLGRESKPADALPVAPVDQVFHEAGSAVLRQDRYDQTPLALESLEDGERLLAGFAPVAPLA
jgi:hypothetical protein